MSAAGLTAQPRVRVLDSAGALFQAAAEEFAARATAAVKQSGRFAVALSGGSTPKGMFSLLATSAFSSVPWDKTFFFWGDERHVPPDNPESNYRMAHEALLAKIPARPANVFRIKAEDSDAARAALDYERVITTFFGLKPGEFPRFDLILLGLGPEGHVASLFPGSAAMEETQRLVVANWVEKFHTNRITFTFPVLNHAACVMFLASGAGKAAIVKQILSDPTAGLPAQRVRPTDGDLLWFLDKGSAGD
ncbi:MAG TPA: 6-phosphogluconolactonase [Terriglobales bacterium]|nr:6-phosphogluconolactonase [Terriglobales bacterium]